MDFQLLNNHIILNVETNLGLKACVFDTGSPFTFFFDSVNEYKIEGITHNVVPNPMAMMINFQKVNIDKMIGIEIDGFIGTDFIMEQGEVLIDFPNSQLYFNNDNVDESNAIPMRTFHGLPIFDVTYNGVVAEAAFDSGAMYSFISSNMLNILEISSPINIFDDFNPILGKFTASLYECSISIGGIDLGTQNIAIAKAYDQSLSLVGIEAFIGIDTFKNHRIWLSYKDKKVCVY